MRCSAAQRVTVGCPVGATRFFFGRRDYVTHFVAINRNLSFDRFSAARQSLYTAFVSGGHSGNADNLIIAFVPEDPPSQPLVEGEDFYREF
jgi:hypothetical protein